MSNQKICITVCDSIDASRVKCWMQRIQEEISTFNPVEITLYFSSSGGSVSDALTFYWFLKALPCTLTIHVVGNVESAGNIVILAADIRKSTSTAYYVFHDILMNVVAGHASLSRVEHARQCIRRARVDLAQIIAERSAIRYNAAIALIKNGRVMNASEALSKGVITSIEGYRLSTGIRHIIL